jgi:bisphosphoglycerate-independent phosphoglycerate mutase (AlkP superfamily)
MVNDGWRRQMGHADLPDVTEEEAGRNLARIADAADLTLYAHYATDTAGHRAGMEGAVAALERVDRFLKGVLDVLTAHVTVLVASDHGNIEDVTAQHTRNPALGLTAGPGAAKLADRLRTLLDVTPVALEHLGVRG